MKALGGSTPPSRTKEPPQVGIAFAARPHLVGDTDPNPSLDSRVGALTGLHILIIEDDRDARDILSMVLQHFGGLVMAVKTANEGLQCLRNIIPDVVVADFQLPDHDASWLVSEARRRGFSVPFVAVSAADFDPSILSDYGFESYLRKPIDHAQLVDTVLAVVRGR